MKKALVFFSFLFFLSMAPAYAIMPTPSPTSSPTAILQQQIDNLKDRIASRVAQLKLVEKKGIIGTVTDISETQISLSDVNGNTRFIDVDELTKFSSPSAKGNFGISDITKGQTIGIIGLYNKESRRLLARFIDVLALPIVVDGIVNSVDKTNFTFEITKTDKNTQLVDVENFTRTLSYTKSGGLVRTGFSKIILGAKVIIVGFADVKNKNMIVSSRTIIFPDLSSATPSPTAALQTSQTPASKSAK